MSPALKKNILAVLLLAASSASAATQVPSSIAGTTFWDRSGNPYLISGKVQVPQGSLLKVGPGVRVQFQPGASLEVAGSLQVAGAAAAPAVFDMTQGGTQSEIFINGGEARVGYARILGGLFLARDAKVSFKGSEVTKSGGLYLQGSTRASMKGNKIYGNAAGIVLDGPVVASIQFNTLVQNTYGLYLKSFSTLTFRYNSVHGNQKEVVNQGARAPLGGNFWGTSDAASLATKVQGPVDTLPLKGLKDVLRAYIRSELPVITQEMSDKQTAKERKEAKESALALKKLRKAQEEPKIVKTAPGAEAPEAQEAPAPAMEEAAAPAPEPSIEEKTAPEPPAMTQGKAKTAKVTPLEPAPQKLKTLANLPPDMGDQAKIPSAPLPGGSTSFESAAPASSGTDSTAMPPMQDLSPPDLESVEPPALSTASNTAAPPPPPPAAPASNASTDNGDIPIPPSEEDSASKPSTSAPAPAAAAPSTSPAPPSVPAAEPSTEMQPPDLGTPTESESAAAQKLGQDVPVGDIDGMQAPPLDIFGDLATVPLDDSTVGKGKTKPKAKDSEISLPPLQDSDIEPPKDLDLPPTDDLGNFNLDSKQ